MKKKENDEIRITPDALISLVVTEAEERELASMPSLKEMNAQFHPSEQFQKKMDRLLKKAHRKEGWVQIWKPTKKVLIAFTSVMTALTFGSVGTHGYSLEHHLARYRFHLSRLYYEKGVRRYSRFRSGSSRTGWCRCHYNLYKNWSSAWNPWHPVCIAFIFY
jgi:hypothetical protein